MKPILTPRINKHVLNTYRRLLPGLKLRAATGDPVAVAALANCRRRLDEVLARIAANRTD